jgi:uncharacterized membrane protein YidH (DUF202 family)
MTGLSACPDMATRLALNRTRLAQDRTLMAWVRTAITLVTFGFTVYKAFLLMGTGIFALSLAKAQHRSHPA